MPLLVGLIAMGCVGSIIQPYQRLSLVLPSSIFLYDANASVRFVPVNGMPLSSTGIRKRFVGQYAKTSAPTLTGGVAPSIRLARSLQEKNALLPILVTCGKLAVLMVLQCVNAYSPMLVTAVDGGEAVQS